jgi:DNA repair protein RadC
MHRRPSDHDCDLAPHPRAQYGNRWQGLRDLDHDAISLRDSYPVVGRHTALQPSEKARQISLVAQHIAPLAGERAWHVAAKLLTSFGTISNALEASPGRLSKALDGEDKLVDTIVAMRHLFRAASRERIVARRVDADDAGFREYVHSHLDAGHEKFMIFYAGAQLEYIGEEVIASGSNSQVCAGIRSIVDRALELRAAALMLAHNHPSGCGTPSQADIESTKRIETVAKALDLWVIDHLIVANQQIFSMRRGGAL